MKFLGADSFKGLGAWAVILGGSSGFGLASAKKLSQLGLNICLVHRDRRGSMERIEEHFNDIRATGVTLLPFNLDGLSAEGRNTTLTELAKQAGPGSVRVLLHSIAFGSLKKLCPSQPLTSTVVSSLATRLKVSVDSLQSAIDETFAKGQPELASLLTQPDTSTDQSYLDDDDLALTISAMGTSLLSWTRDIFNRNLFCNDARILGLTSEGNEIAWHGYAAVSAAKCALESISRSIAREFAPYGIRANILQPGVTDTPAFRMIPGSNKMAAHAQLRNPFGRLTTVDDVAGVVALMTSDEAAWINGSLIRVDGGEAISG